MISFEEIVRLWIENVWVGEGGLFWVEGVK